ncbi:MAG: 30S ribosomal protein S20 [Candidatus Limnocylindrales bacterium]
MAKTPRGWTGARTPSAIKRVRQAQRRRAINQPRKSAAKTYVANALAVAGDGNETETAVALAEAMSALDRAAKVGAIHPNNAARRKSRLAIKLNALAEGVAVQPTGRATKTTGTAAAVKAARTRIATAKASKAKGPQTAAGKAKAALSKTARAEAASAAAAAAAPVKAAPAKAPAKTVAKTAAKAAEKPAPKAAPAKAPAKTVAKTAEKPAPKAQDRREAGTQSFGAQEAKALTLSIESACRARPDDLALVIRRPTCPIQGPGPESSPGTR